ncbi:hypothetical protein [Streptomyces sp. NPDC051569]|uniref:hypothetical protein n=1 Tax=Streptomyces sp. NPDC051569 TaxID=3365661 RepID=UPI0037B60EE1
MKLRLIGLAAVVVFTALLPPTACAGPAAPAAVTADGTAGARDTWTRTYYRNVMGSELLAVLGLMGPGGRSVQTHCAAEAKDEPATCESPHEPSRGEPAEYTAMAEFAPTSSPAPTGGGADGGNSTDIEPLLLRSGSNSQDPPVR